MPCAEQELVCAIEPVTCADAVVAMRFALAYRSEPGPVSPDGYPVAVAHAVGEAVGGGTPTLVRYCCGGGLWGGKG